MRVLVRSYGCSTNLADGEVLAGCLETAGHKVVNEVSSADLIIYNTCAVKGPTENRMISILKTAPMNKKVIVAGCLPLINAGRVNRETRFDGITGPAAGNRIVEIAERVFAGEKVVNVDGSMTTMPSLNLPRLAVNPLISIIPVSYGCMGSCAYCCVSLARGHLRSHGIAEITERIKKDVEQGVKEFWVTSQDTACYGRDRGTNLAELLKEISQIEGDFAVRVGMMTPNSVLGMLDEVIEALRDERVYKFLHLPLQSGNDEVLKRMHRFYSVCDFTKIVETFRASFPDLSLSTDIICGFPGETSEAFQNTMDVIAEIKPDVVNVSKFFARPRTLAAEMTEDSVPLAEIKRRSNTATRIAAEVREERNRRWIGWKGAILINEAGKILGTFVGRNFAYKPIVVKSTNNLFGKKAQVEIVQAHSTYLEGKLCE